MNRNIELKARCPDLTAAQRAARELPAVLHGVERQRDTYFRVARGRLKLRERWSFSSSGLLEQACAAQLIWYDRTDAAHARPSDYSLLVVENGVQFCELLKGALGFVAEVEKLRTIYLHNNVRIHLDEVKGLGTFLEFEAIVDETCDEATAGLKLDRLFSEFHLTADSVIASSYSDLLRC